MNKLYLIHPLNEGQELNYVETFRFGRQGAISRASFLALRLAEAMSQGSIAVEVRSAKTNKLVFYGIVEKTIGGEFKIKDATAEMV